MFLLSFTEEYQLRTPPFYHLGSNRNHLTCTGFPVSTETYRFSCANNILLNVYTALHINLTLCIMCMLSEYWVRYAAHVEADFIVFCSVAGVKSSTHNIPVSLCIAFLNSYTSCWAIWRLYCKDVIILLLHNNNHRSSGLKNVLLNPKLKRLCEDFVFTALATFSFSCDNILYNIVTAKSRDFLNHFICAHIMVS